MAKRYYLVTDAVAEQVTRRTGLPAHDTFLGAIIERPKPFNLGDAMADLQALRGNNPRCICGRQAIMHRPNCPFAMIGPA